MNARTAYAEFVLRHGRLASGILSAIAALALAIWFWRTFVQHDASRPGILVFIASIAIIMSATISRSLAKARS